MDDHGKKIKEGQPNNPLHGVKLAEILDYMVKEYGWDDLSLMINIRCFKNNPSVNSSLKFLRRTPWARNKLEKIYLQAIKNN